MNEKKIEELFQSTEFGRSLADLLKRVYKIGHDDGYEKALNINSEASYNNGYNKGHDEGYDEGHYDGWDEGWDQGFDSGKKEYNFRHHSNTQRRDEKGRFKKAG